MVTNNSRFTSRGIVALVFSCVTGLLGVAVVAWYGFSQAVEEAPRAVTSIIRNADMSESDNSQIVSSSANAGRTTT